MEIIERAATRLGSYGKLAKALGISVQQMSSIKTGRIAATPYQIGKCAEICGEPWEQHAFAALMEQERTPAGREFWRGKLLRHTATAALVCLVSFLTIMQAHGASSPALPTAKHAFGTVDIM